MKLRLLCRVFFEREADRQTIPPEYNNCPTECGNSPRYYNPQRSKYCDGCPHKLERDSFKEQTEQTVLEIMGATAFDFAAVSALFYAVRNAEDKPREKISVKFAAYLNVYLSEKRRNEAIKDAAK